MRRLLLGTCQSAAASNGLASAVQCRRLSVFFLAFGLLSTTSLTSVAEEEPGQCTNEPGSPNLCIPTRDTGPDLSMICEEQLKNSESKELCNIFAHMVEYGKRCNIKRIDARDSNAYETYLEFARSRTPFVMTNLRPSDAYTNSIGDLYAQIPTSVRTTMEEIERIKVNPGRDSKSLKGVRFSFHKVAYMMQKSQDTAVKTGMIVRRKTELRTGVVDYRKNSYKFPGPMPIDAVGNISKVFGDPRAVISGAIRYDHAATANDTKVHMQGAFMGSLFHRTTGEFHEVVQGATHAFLYERNSKPPFGEDSWYPHVRTHMFEWMLQDRYSIIEPEYRPTWECTLGAGEMLFVPHMVSRGWFNFVPTMTLVRSGCHGGLPGLLREVVENERCPGVMPIDSPPDSQPITAFVPQDIEDPDYKGLLSLSMSDLAGDSAWVSGDFRLKFLVFSGGRRDEDVEALKAAEEYSNAAKAAKSPWIWVHINCGPDQNFCGFSQGNLPKLMVDVRAILGADKSVQDLGQGVSSATVSEFLSKYAVQLEGLKSRLEVLAA